MPDSKQKLSKPDRELRARAVAAIESQSDQEFPDLVAAMRARGILDNPDAKTLLGSLLHVAALRANLFAAGVLLGAGAQIDVRGFRNTTPLMIAADAGALAVMQHLVRSCADVKATDSFGQTALHHAAGTILASREVVEFLLEAGAEPNATDRSGRTPLHRAAGVIDPEKIEALLKAGADPLIVADGEQGNPLRYLNETVRDLPSTKQGQRDRCALLLSR
jgi:ankyrin repeat protein